MQPLPFFPLTAERDGDGLPAIVLQNLYPAQEVDLLRQLGRPGPALIGHFGAATWATVGSGNCRGLFCYPGAAGGDLYAVIGTTLYRINSSGAPTTIGTVTGSDPVIFDMIRDTLLLAADNKAWFTTGSSLTQIADADLGNVSAVTGIDGRAIFALTASDSFKWSNVFDPATIGALDFATAETYGDRLVRPVAVNRQLLLLGERSVEVWGATSESVAPFRRQGSAVWPIGCASAHAVAQLSGVVFFVDHTPVALKWEGGAISRISDPAMDRLIETVTLANRPLITGFAYQQAGQGFYVLDLPEVGTYQYHVQSQTWSRRRHGGNTQWHAQRYAFAFGRHLVAGAGNVIRELNSYATDAGAPMDRIAQTFVPTRANLPISSIALDAYVAVATGAPVAAVALSSDDGRTFSAARDVGIARTGRRAPSRWGWGMIQAPGAILRATYSGSHQIALFNALVNEPIV